MDRRDRYRPLRKQFFLRDFSAADLERAGAIALQIWGDEVGFIPPVLIPKVYDFLLRYYFDPYSPFICAVTEDSLGVNALAVNVNLPTRIVRNRGENHLIVTCSGESSCYTIVRISFINYKLRV